MIPPHAWGGSLARIGARPLVVGRSGWAIILAATDADQSLRDAADAGASTAMTAAVPTRARMLPAGELAALLAPAVGEHCTACDDDGERVCPCCLGKTSLACAAAGCAELHGCDTCLASGRVRCVCYPPPDLVAVIRGARFSARLLVPLRGLLSRTPPGAPVTLWASADVPMADERKSFAVALSIDLGFARYVLAEKLPDDGDEITEVTL